MNTQQITDTIMNNIGLSYNYARILTIFNLALFTCGIILVLFELSKWFVLLCPTAILLQFICSALTVTGD